MKLKNWICPKCGDFKEILFTDNELKDVEGEIIFNCPTCGEKMKAHNFKNNPQRWKFLD